MTHESLVIVLLSIHGPLHYLVEPLAQPVLLLLQFDGYGFWSSIISALRGIGVAAAGVGLMVAILIKGAAANNSDRHATAARIAEGVFAGLFVVLLGWFIYDLMVRWTPL
jgi:hypothetical protein